MSERQRQEREESLLRILGYVKVIDNSRTQFLSSERIKSNSSTSYSFQWSKPQKIIFNDTDKLEMSKTVTSRNFFAASTDQKQMSNTETALFRQVHKDLNSTQSPSKEIQITSNNQSNNQQKALKMPELNKKVNSNWEMNSFVGGFHDFTSGYSSQRRKLVISGKESTIKSLFVTPNNEIESRKQNGQSSSFNSATNAEKIHEKHRNPLHIHRLDNLLLPIEQYKALEEKIEEQKPLEFLRKKEEVEDTSNIIEKIFSHQQERAKIGTAEIKSQAHQFSKSRKKLLYQLSSIQLSEKAGKHFNSKGMSNEKVMNKSTTKTFFFKDNKLNIEETSNQLLKAKIYQEKSQQKIYQEVKTNQESIKSQEKIMKEKVKSSYFLEHQLQQKEKTSQQKPSSFLKKQGPRNFGKSCDYSFKRASSIEKNIVIKDEDSTSLERIVILNTEPSVASLDQIKDNYFSNKIFKSQNPSTQRAGSSQFNQEMQQHSAESNQNYNSSIKKELEDEKDFEKKWKFNPRTSSYANEAIELPSLSSRKLQDQSLINMALKNAGSRKSPHHLSHQLLSIPPNWPTSSPTNQGNILPSFQSSMSLGGGLSQHTMTDGKKDECIKIKNSSQLTISTSSQEKIQLPQSNSSSLLQGRAQFSKNLIKNQGTSQLEIPPTKNNQITPQSRLSNIISPSSLGSTSPIKKRFRIQQVHEDNYQIMQQVLLDKMKQSEVISQYVDHCGYSLETFSFYMMKLYIFCSKDLPRSSFFNLTNQFFNSSSSSGGNSRKMHSQALKEKSDTQLIDKINSFQQELVSNHSPQSNKAQMQAFQYPGKKTPIKGSEQEINWKTYSESNPLPSVKKVTLANNILNSTTPTNFQLEINKLEQEPSESIKEDRIPEFPTVKVNETTLLWVKDIFCNKMMDMHIPLTQVRKFEEKFTKSLKYFMPQSFVDNLGGSQNVKLIVIKLMEYLCYDINMISTFDSQMIEYITEGVLHLLKQEQKNLVQYLTKIKKSSVNEISNAEFYQIKISVLKVMKTMKYSDNLIRQVQQKIEKQRNFFNVNDFIKDQQFKQAFLHSIQKNKRIVGYLLDPSQQTMTLLYDMLFDCLYGTTRYIDFIDFLELRLKVGNDIPEILLDELYKTIIDCLNIDKFNTVDKQTMIFVRDTMIKMERFKVKANLKSFSFMEISLSITELTKLVIEYLEYYLININLINNVKEDQILNQDFLEEYLYLVMSQEEQVFSLYDLDYACSYYNITDFNFCFQIWLEAIHDVLLKNTPAQPQQVNELIEFLRLNSLPTQVQHSQL